MAKAFITGINGFIGTNLAGFLLSGDPNCEVTGLVRPTSDTRSLVKLFKTYGPRLRLVLGDVRDPPTLEAGVADADYIYHLAAVLLAPRRTDFLDTNAEGTRNVLEAALRRHNKNPIQRVIVTSSIAAAGPSPTVDPIDENHPERPISWYGESKLRAECIARQFMADDLPITIARPVLVYGEGDRDFSGGIFPIVSKGIRLRFGFKHKSVSMIYVGDLVEGMVAAAQSPNSVGGKYFFSNPNSYLDTDVSSSILAAFSKRPLGSLPIPHFVMTLVAWLYEFLYRVGGTRPMLTRDKVRELRQRWWTVTPSAAEQDFDWRSATSLLSGMQRAVVDWKDRKAACAAPLPRSDKSLTAVLLAVIAGIAIESVAQIGGWYTFTRWWLSFAVVVLGFGAGMGMVSLYTSARSRLVQFLAGASVGFVGELANALWLNFWHFSPEIAERLPANPWAASLVVGLPLGFVPIFINFVADALNRRRLRYGCGQSEDPREEDDEMAEQNGETTTYRNRLRVFEIEDAEFEKTGIWTVLKLIWNTIATSINYTEGLVLASTFVLILLWGTHGKLEILLGWLPGWEGPGSDPESRRHFLTGIPWDQELISWVAGFILLVLVPAILIKWVYPNKIEGCKLRDYGLCLPPRDRWNFTIVSSALLFSVSLVGLYLGIHGRGLSRIYPLFRGEFDDLLQFALYEMSYLLFFVAIEFIFRGYLLSGVLRSRKVDLPAGLTKKSGLPPYGYYAVLISMLSYTAWHLGKPPEEMLSTLLWGFAAGGVVLVSRSVVPVIIVHWLLNVVMDLVLWKGWIVATLMRHAE